MSSISGSALPKRSWRHKLHNLLGITDTDAKKAQSTLTKEIKKFGKNTEATFAFLGGITDIEYGLLMKRYHFTVKQANEFKIAATIEYNRLRNELFKEAR